MHKWKTFEPNERDYELNNLLVEALNEHDPTSNVYDNVKLPVSRSTRTHMRDLIEENLSE